MMTVEEIRNWLSTLPPDEGVWIDEGGLILVSDGAYLEVGGEPDEENATCE